MPKRTADMQTNNEVFYRLAEVLRENVPLCNDQLASELTVLGLTRTEAFCAFLLSSMGLDADSVMGREIYRGYLPKMVHEVPAGLVLDDPYVKAIGEVYGRNGNKVLTMERLEPYVPFVCGSFICEGERVYPQLGFLTEPVRFPAVYENGLSWMSAEPNEIVTLKPLAEKAEGQVVCLGLGLGYYAFHALLNPRVNSVICIEREQDMIALFRDKLLPFFPRSSSLTIVEEDAFWWVEHNLEQTDPDTVLVDIWRDAGDGMSCYTKMKELQRGHAQWQYWIEDEICYYLGLKKEIE